MTDKDKRTISQCETPQTDPSMKKSVNEMRTDDRSQLKAIVEHADAWLFDMIVATARQN